MTHNATVNTPENNTFAGLPTRVREQLAVAEDKLESGLHFKNKEKILESLQIFRLWENVPGVLDKMVRAYTCLCLVDQANALSHLHNAQKINPNDPAVLNNLGYLAHKQSRDFEKSVDYYQKCLEVEPTYETAYLGILDIFRSLGHTKLEEEYVKRAVKHCPNSAELLNCYGLWLSYNSNVQNNMSQASNMFRKALSLKSEPATVSKIHLNIGHLHNVTGKTDEALIDYINSIKSDTSHDLPYSNILLNLHYITTLNSPGITAVCKAFGVSVGIQDIQQVIHELHKAIMRAIHGDEPFQPSSIHVPRIRPVNKKLHLAFIGADFCNHAVSCFIGGLLKTLVIDHAESVRVFVYANTIYDKATQEGIACHDFRGIKDVSTEAVIDAMQNMDNIDVLVDLSGHTSGHRMDVIAKRPVDTIFSYCGYPNDLGFPFVKRITDEFTEATYGVDNSDQIVKLERVFLSYHPPSVYMDLEYKKWDKYNPDGLVTLGCFAKLPKINARVIKTWCSILNMYPKTRLVLKSKCFIDTGVLSEWRAKFGSYASRVLFINGTEGSDEHMRLFNIIDLHLDTFPYSGTTITTESLFMNVPVLTLCPPKSAHVTRVSGSIIKEIGLEDELVATSTRDYMLKVGQLIKKVHTLNVRDKLSASSLMDSKLLGKMFLKAITS